jgi:EXPERA (EXPanded EBP superfamily)
MASTPARSVALARSVLSTSDKTVIGLILIFTSVAVTLELYWLIFNQVMESRSDILGRALAIYWPADYTYRVTGYPIEKAFTLSLEGVNTLLTPFLSALLIWAILKRRPYRYPLQLLIGAYTAYGTFLYYSVAHISNYAVFSDRSVPTYLTFYLMNLPWLTGYTWIAYDAFIAIVRGERA